MALELGLWCVFEVINTGSHNLQVGDEVSPIFTHGEGSKDQTRQEKNSSECKPLYRSVFVLSKDAGQQKSITAQSTQ